MFNSVQRYDHRSEYAQCVLCEVHQPTYKMEKNGRLGYICMDQDRCKRWRIQRLEVEPTNPSFIPPGRPLAASPDDVDTKPVVLHARPTGSRL